MKKALVLVLLVVVAGCQNMEALGPGNNLAVENQTNLEKNVVRQLNNFEKLAKAQPNWTEEDAKIFAKQKAEIIEQIAINYGWLLVIKEAVEANDLDPTIFGVILENLPTWIQQGKNIYDLVKEKTKKSD